MRARTAVIGLALAFAVAKGVAAPATSNEPFTSFRAIDKQLSVINDRSAKLQSGKNRVERIQGIRAVRGAIARIRNRCQRLTSLYRARHQRFGVRMFRALDQRALAVSKSMTGIERARNGGARGRAIELFNQATVQLVLEFQAISANYGANHCVGGQWSCCQPRRNPETNRGPVEGCKWSCVATQRACSGFVGPRTTKEIPQPH